jgi:hypothetical protein
MAYACPAAAAAAPSGGGGGGGGNGAAAGAAASTAMEDGKSDSKNAARKKRKAGEDLTEYFDLYHTSVAEGASGPEFPGVERLVPSQWGLEHSASVKRQQIVGRSYIKSTESGKEEGNRRLLDTLAEFAHNKSDVPLVGSIVVFNGWTYKQPEAAFEGAVMYQRQIIPALMMATAVVIAAQHQDPNPFNVLTTEGVKLIKDASAAK